MPTLRLLLSGAALAAFVTSAHAQEAVRHGEDGTGLDELVVFGRAEQKIGTAVAASEGALAGADLTVRPLLRTAEILESVPGMIVTQHSGSGKANQYFLRGFNLDHGTDFGVTIDGVPMNFRTHGHGQGYLDINGLIPELVQRVDYRKGPYRADFGDFNMVGGAVISTRDTFEHPFAQVEGGDFGWRRAVAGGSFSAMGGEVLLAAQGKTYDGPWQLPEDLRHLSLYGKYSTRLPAGAFRASLSTYDATWRPTEQIPERAIGSLIADAFGALDLDLTGRTRREILTAQLDASDWRGSLYAQHYDWSMISNFTFFLDDPVNGDQTEQTEKLWTYGGRLERDFTLTSSLKLKAGTEGRYDDIETVGLYQTVAGVRIATRSEAAVQEGSGALYAEAGWKPNDRFSLMAGLRGDAYSFRTRALGGGAFSGQVRDDIVSPKIGVSYKLADGLAVYANWGRGFHSNDARGVTAPVSPAPGLVKGVGQEVGVRFERNRLVATATYWGMEVDSELIYVGDAGSVEPSNASERRGYELTAFWRPLPGLAIDGVWTQSRARFKDSPGAEFIPGALKNAGELGVAYIRPQWNVGARLRHLGVHPLVEDNSRESEPTTIVNLRTAWTPGERFEAYAELLNVFDSDKKDIEYFYESYLPAIDTAGPVEDIHSRAVEPRMLRVGLKANF